MLNQVELNSKSFHKFRSAMEMTKGAHSFNVGYFGIFLCTLRQPHFFYKVIEYILIVNQDQSRYDIQEKTFQVITEKWK